MSHQHNKIAIAKLYRRQREAKTLERYGRRSFALVKAEQQRRVEVLEPSCDLCCAPLKARVTVETEEHGAQQMNLCARHIDHLRQYIGVERYQAQRESEVA